MLRQNIVSRNTSFGIINYQLSTSHTCCVSESVNAKWEMDVHVQGTSKEQVHSLKNSEGKFEKLVECLLTNMIHSHLRV